MTALLSYILLGLALAMAPGAMTVQMVKQALRNGFLSGWFVGLGGMTIDLTLIMLIYFGLSHVLTHHMVEIVMWLLGFIFLLVIGIDSLKESRTPVDFSGNKLLFRFQLVVIFRGLINDISIVISSILTPLNTNYFFYIQFRNLSFAKQLLYNKRRLPLFNNRTRLLRKMISLIN